MFLDKIDIAITLIAALAVAAVSLLTGISLPDMALRLVITIVVFYIMGFAIKLYLRQSVFGQGPAPKELRETEDEPEAAEENEEDSEIV